MRMFRGYEGQNDKPSYEVKAMTLHEAKAKIAKEIGKSYSWHNVNGQEYYDIVIRDSETRAMYYRLEPLKGTR